MKTWLADFIERNNVDPANLVPYRGGVGVHKGGYTESNFVGHAVHYKKGNEWMPITLKHSQGDWEGSDFGWNGFAVTHKKKVLYQPNAIIFNGVVIPLVFYLDADNFRYVAGVPNIGEYVIQFWEGGVKEMLNIPEPLDGVLEFDVSHRTKPDELYKSERKIVTQKDAQTGNVFVLTPQMTYPMVIDPDYSGNTADASVYGTNGTYATARSTSSGIDGAGAGTIWVGQLTGYYVTRGYFKFDTSGIPDTDIVSQVNAKITNRTSLLDTNFTARIHKYDWSASDPITAGNQETVYDGALASTYDADWRDTASGMSDDTQYTSSNLAVAWVSKTTFTHYAMLSSRDVSNTTPTNNEVLYLRSQDDATPSYRPVLTVVHSAGGSSRSSRLSLLGVG